MPKFVVEREFAGAGKLTLEELRVISQKSYSVMENMSPEIQWIYSYVTDDKIYCVFIAPDAETVRTHAERAGIPANSIARVRSMIDPTTGQMAA
jgi:hypothetical protein